MTSAGWHFWIDRGGTFTDVIAYKPPGQLHTLKLLSDSPEHYADAAVEGIRRLLAKSATQGDSITEIRLGTTVATNALLERTGPPTALVTNHGFADVLAIGDQRRPDIFALDIRRIKPLYKRVVEVAGRLDYNGTELEPLDAIAAEQCFRDLAHQGIESVAICLLHAWKSAEHEIQLAAIARGAGFKHITVSHETSPLMKFVNRGATTVADAYLSPVLQRYTDQFQTELKKYSLQCDRLLFMQSNGGLVSAHYFRGKDAVLSGPAGGVMGIAAAAKAARLTHVIGFDMGGTSTDVALFAGQAETVDECEVAGLKLVKPTMRVHTIAAGGGSLLKFASGRLQVGPESAGANPGPSAYGRSGPLTITDANLLLGRIQSEYFPAVFGRDGNQPLKLDPVTSAFNDLAVHINRQSTKRYTPEQAAIGFLRIAVDSMANAIRDISIQRGVDPADYVLCCLGGAAGQHACQLADQLGMRSILLDPMAGVLSALGIGVAPRRHYQLYAVNKPLTPTSLNTLAEKRRAMEHTCRQILAQQGVAQSDTAAWLELKQTGSDTTISVEWRVDSELAENFAQAHRARFGFDVAADQIFITAMRVEATTESNVLNSSSENVAETRPAMNTSPAVDSHVQMYSQDNWHTVPVYERENIKPGMTIAGPALIAEANSTIILEADWCAITNSAQQILLNRTKALSTRKVDDDSIRPDPVMLEIYNNQFMHIATQMGAVLEQTAHSVNIKERLDFSCAIFDPRGNLLANAPHIPVHLGSMDAGVQNLLEEHRDDLTKGTCFASNAPYKGGTHLPDVTVVTPVLNKSGSKLVFLVAARAHHADIGGITPGSMPPQSQHIDEEGIVLDNVAIVREGELLETALREILSSGPWPARNPDQNIADFKAQLAANERGRHLLCEMSAERGDTQVSRYCEHLLNNAEESVRAVISRLSNGTFRYPFDNGQHIEVAVKVDMQTHSAVIDFTGTSTAEANNLNAPGAVTQAAVMYVFRALVNSDIPLNAGCRRPLQLVLPAGSMLNPEYPAAVVGGNVETSQCIVDALFGALGVLAASQGTMNNLSFGNAELQYYETICGGAGAGDDYPGTSAVQTHMTNSRMTDPEVLESRFPILVREFSIRKNSGGAGRQPGGDGVIRKLEFRESMHAAILSNHRVVAPFGLEGGDPGKTGRNQIIRAAGTIENYDGILTSDMQPGDILVIATPGGGGYGPPESK
jgi:5-oxoprolinase (ATP-hydrolysing)